MLNGLYVVTFHDRTWLTGASLLIGRGRVSTAPFVMDVTIFILRGRLYQHVDSAALSRLFRFTAAFIEQPMHSHHSEPKHRFSVVLNTAFHFLKSYQTPATWLVKFLRISRQKKRIVLHMQCFSNCT